MNTPICEFVKNYNSQNPLRLHMPGHKGKGFLGVENLDITEVFGADSLYEADGIIAESEANASKLFDCPTFYSTEGSSQCIRAMVRLAMLHSFKQGKIPKIAAGRNAHKTFLSAAALLNTDVVWLSSDDENGYLSCNFTPQELEKIIHDENITAVYLTSPDYLGNMADISLAAEICHKNNVLLLVDNAHGAYLHFLQKSFHPMDLGADICCDSAHKTLPVLTGGAYLHIRDEILAKDAKEALALFGSTSPSYLILQSLDAANLYLENYPELLSEFIPKVEKCKEDLRKIGWTLYGNEVLKITLCPKNRGYSGEELAEILLKNNIVCEFADPDYLVLMLTPEITSEDLQKLKSVLTLEKKEAILQKAPSAVKCPQKITPRQAMLSVSETIDVENSLGRIMSAPSVGCPPAVPIVLCGQEITQEAIAAFRYYGIKTCKVVASFAEI